MNDVTSGSEDRAVDEPEDGQVRAHGYGEEQRRGECCDRCRDQAADGSRHICTQTINHGILLHIHLKR